LIHAHTSGSAKAADPHRPYGCGKTHLGGRHRHPRVKQGQPAFFIVCGFAGSLRATNNPQSSDTYDKRFDEVRRAPFLVLDDLGTESATPWAQEKLFQLFNHRYVSRLPTIVTTARPLDDLDPKLRARLLDVTRCTIFGILAPAYRGQGASGVADSARRGGRKR
jgi:DNA replication protein DnaC